MRESPLLLMDIKVRYESPNCWTETYKPHLIETIDTIVIHHTGFYPLSQVIDWFCNRRSGVSAHYLVDRNGDIYQFVDEKNRAWHCGNSILYGVKNVNRFSVGIELFGDGNKKDYTIIQMMALLALTGDIKDRYKIPRNRIVGHQHISPVRKVDPGEKFYWFPFLESL